MPSHEVSRFFFQLKLSSSKELWIILKSGKQPVSFPKEAHEVGFFFFFNRDVSRNIQVQTHELWYSEGKCWLSHLLCDMLENINYLGEREVFLLFYSKLQIISNIYLNGTWFLLCGMWLLLFALWNISTQRALDGANHSLFQPFQIKPPFFDKQPHPLKYFPIGQKWSSCI